MSRIRLFLASGPTAHAFETCVAPHLERMWHLALHLQPDPDDAEDLVQDLLLRAWRHRKQVLALDAPGPWLARVLYRLHVDRWRRRGALGMAASLDVPDAPDLPSPSAEQAVLAGARLSELMDAVHALPESQRLVLLMHEAPAGTTALPARSARTVTLAVASVADLQGVTIQLLLPPGVEVEGHPGLSVIQWEDNLVEGTSRLSIPLLLDGETDGSLVARIEHQGRSRELRVPLAMSAGRTVNPKGADAPRSAL